MSWQTRTLASFIIVGAQVDDQGQKKLHDAVDAITMDPDDTPAREDGYKPVEHIKIDAEGNAIPSFPAEQSEDEADTSLDFLEDHEGAIARAAARNSAGSYEKLMTGFQGGG